MADPSTYIKVAGQILSVHDGDTADSELQVCGGLFLRTVSGFPWGRLRLAAVQAAELAAPLGPAHAASLTTLLSTSTPGIGPDGSTLFEWRRVTVWFRKLEEHGRLLAFVWTKPYEAGVLEASVNAQMLKVNGVELYKGQPLRF